MLRTAVGRSTLIVRDDVRDTQFGERTQALGDVFDATGDHLAVHSPVAAVDDGPSEPGGGGVIVADEDIAAQSDSRFGTQSSTRRPIRIDGSGERRPLHLWPHVPCVPSPPRSMAAGAEPAPTHHSTGSGGRGRIDAPEIPRSGASTVSPANNRLSMSIARSVTRPLVERLDPLQKLLGTSADSGLNDERHIGHGCERADLLGREYRVPERQQQEQPDLPVGRPVGHDPPEGRNVLDIRRVPAGRVVVAEAEMIEPGTRGRRARSSTARTTSRSLKSA